MNDFLNIGQVELYLFHMDRHAKQKLWVQESGDIISLLRTL